MRTLVNSWLGTVKERTIVSWHLLHSSTCVEPCMRRLSDKAYIPQQVSSEAQLRRAAQKSRWHLHKKYIGLRKRIELIAAPETARSRREHYHTNSLRYMTCRL